MAVEKLCYPIADYGYYSFKKTYFGHKVHAFITLKDFPTTFVARSSYVRKTCYVTDDSS